MACWCVEVVVLSERVQRQSVGTNDNNLYTDPPSRHWSNHVHK